MCRHTMRAGPVHESVLIIGPLMSARQEQRSQRSQAADVNPHTLPPRLRGQHGSALLRFSDSMCGLHLLQRIDRLMTTRCKIFALWATAGLLIAAIWGLYFASASKD